MKIFIILFKQDCPEAVVHALLYKSMYVCKFFWQRVPSSSIGNIVALLHSILFALNWVAIKKEVAFLDKNLFTACVCTRDRHRFFDRVKHETMYASSGNKHFFNK